MLTLLSAPSAPGQRTRHERAEPEAARFVTVATFPQPRRSAGRHVRLRSGPHAVQAPERGLAGTCSTGSVVRVALTERRQLLLPGLGERSSEIVPAERPNVMATYWPRSHSPGAMSSRASAGPHTPGG